MTIDKIATNLAALKEINAVGDKLITIRQEKYLKMLLSRTTVRLNTEYVR